jgi:membrane protein DedA with SNARE-associated domain
MSDLEPKVFILYAYSGAAIWVCTFIGLGYLLGERWKAVQQNLDHYLAGFTIAGVILAVGYLAWRKWFRKKSK